VNGHHDVNRAMAAIRESVVHSTVGLSHAYLFDLLHALALSVVTTLSMHTLAYAAFSSGS